MQTRARIISAVLLLFSPHAILTQTSSHPSSDEAEEHLHSGISAQQRGDVKTAIEEYRKALEIRPELPEARANLGAALAAVGNFDAAIEEDKRALLDAPDKTSVRMNLALAYYKKGDLQDARPEFEAVHAARPQDISAAMLLGYTEVKLGGAMEAVQLLSPLEPGRESNTDLEFVLASALIQSGSENEGLPRMETVASATHSADSYVIAGSARLHRKEFKEARADLDAAVRLNPSIPGLNTMAGQARDALGDTDAATHAFEDALKADPRDFLANLYLGAIHLKQRDLIGARPLLELALELEPQMPQARLQMAKLDAMTGKNAEAAAALEELEKADPNWLDPHVELAPIYYKLHRPDDGQRERDIVQQIEAGKQKQGPPEQ
jgi:tetratricopeptide (TPR) repeat protein